LQGGGELIAADRSERRQVLTRENFECRNLDCRIIVGAADELKFSPASFDIILVDVPCTNTGVFRHKADALWRFSKSSLSESAKLQESILEKAAELIKVNGQIVYSTCSIEPEENELQIEEFLAKHKDFSLISQKQLLPCKCHDGAFVAIIKHKCLSFY
jgi:16S rRNA (cytosine967-C5)-methyltransferase